MVSVYRDSLPSPTGFDVELHCWWMKWKNSNNTTAAVTLETLVKTLKLVEGDLFPNIQQLLKIDCTLPVTSVECERSIVAYVYLKHICSSMRKERLNGLAMLFIHRDIPCDAEVVEQFARQHKKTTILYFF